MTSARMQRWALILAGYDYTLTFRSGVLNGNADCLSRLPLPTDRREKGGGWSEFLEESQGGSILLMELDRAPVSSSEIKMWSRQDVTISQVIDQLVKGWPNERSLRGENSFKPYLARKEELSVVDGVLMWGNRVVVPPKGRPQVLQELHQSHPGIVRTKSLARSYVWWPGLDQDVTKLIEGCENCQQAQREPSKAPLHPWEWPKSPWVRLHLDYAGPFHDKMFLVVVDAHSKWLEVIPTTGATGAITVAHLRSLFATHGLPVNIVSDNGPAFISEEFKEFCKLNGISHTFTAPYHPSSNGLAERAVQTFKGRIKKMNPSNLRKSLDRFLLNYRTTCHSTTHQTPSSLLMGREVLTGLDLLKPNLRNKVEQQQEQWTRRGERKVKHFEVGDSVFVLGFQGVKWRRGTIVGRKGDVNFEITLSDGSTVHRHADQMRGRNLSEVNSPIDHDWKQGEDPLSEDDVEPESIREEDPPNTVENNDVENPQILSEEEASEGTPPSPKGVVVRRSTRARRGPQHLEDYET